MTLLNSGIYKILNTVNNKFYIGSAVNLNSRFRTHKANLINNKHPNKHLQAAFNKYGADAFEFVIIEYCDKDKLLEREQCWIDETTCFDKSIGYNKRLKVNSNLGLKLPMSEATLIKIVKKTKGLKRTPEQILANSKARKGKKLSKSHIQNAVNGRLGYTHTTETKNKIGKSNSKPEKWSHPKKYKCNCRECLDKKNLIRKQLKLYTLITCEIN